MSDLHQNPKWRAEDLGAPIPNSPHACSVALPLWEHVVGYEEGKAEVVDQMQCGYPRFFIHKSVQCLLLRILCKMASVALCSHES